MRADHRRGRRAVDELNMATLNTIKDAAVERTGLNQFGDDSFEEGLAILLTSLRDEARLNARGEAFIYDRITGYLGQRLQVEDWYRRHPEIGDEPILAPVIGLGLPRTGSTALSMLLAQDPAVRYLRRWESSQPCPHRPRCRASTPASRPTKARCWARAITCPRTPTGRWSVTS